MSAAETDREATDTGSWLVFWAGTALVIAAATGFVWTFGGWPLLVVWVLALPLGFGLARVVA